MIHDNQLFLTLCSLLYALLSDTGEGHGFDGETMPAIASLEDLKAAQENSGRCFFAFS